MDIQEYDPSSSKCSHPFTNTCVYVGTHKLQVWFILLASKSEFVVNVYYKKIQILMFFKKSEHLALFHPIFSMATISWRQRSQPGGSQLRLHNRKRDFFSKMLMPETNSSIIFSNRNSSKCKKLPCKQN